MSKLTWTSKMSLSFISLTLPAKDEPSNSTELGSYKQCQMPLPSTDGDSKQLVLKKKVPFSCLLPIFLNIRNLGKKMTPNGMFYVSTKVPPNDLILSRRTHVFPWPGSPMRPFRPGLNEDRMRTLVVPNDGYHQSLLAKMPHSIAQKKCCCMLPRLLVCKETNMTEARSNCG